MNSFKARTPTIPEEDRDFVPVKHNFSEKFDRPVSTGQRLVPIVLQNGQLKKQEGYILYNIHRETGGPRLTWLSKVGLTKDSHPVEFFEAFLPSNDKLYPNAKCFLERWANNTNFKAMLAFSRQKGYPYPDFTPFSLDEIKKHLGVYILNGLSPSP